MPPLANEAAVLAAIDAAPNQTAAISIAIAALPRFQDGNGPMTVSRIRGEAKSGKLSPAASLLLSDLLKSPEGLNALGNALLKAPAAAVA